MGTQERLTRVREVIEKEKVDALLISSVPNVTYLSGFTGDDSLAMVTPDRQYVITDFRYVEQAQQQCPGWVVVRRKKDIWEATASAVTDASVRRLGFESVHLKWRQHGLLSEAVAGVELVPLEGTVERLRQVKEPEEVAHIESALRAQEAAFAEIREWIRPGLTEKEIACELDYRLRRQGADRSAFETIVAVGKRGSLPHAQPTERVVKTGDAVLIDWGARRFFYNSDLTRVVHLGTVTPLFARVYGVVRQAQERALSAIRPGAAFAEVDGAAREFIRDQGYGEQFGHALGHGVGLEVHESPVVREGNEERLEPGMVFTVEPGIYIPGWGGVRIEDMVLVTCDGVRVLSACDKDLDRMIL